MKPSGRVSDPDLITVPEAARRLSVSETKVWVLIRDGTLKSKKLGEGRKAPRRIRLTDLQDYINSLAG